jgi:hypothetical protein
MRYRSVNKKKVDEINPVCKKAIYHSKAEAEDMIRHITETRETREIKAYRCSVCGFWHLTSRLE